MKRTASRRPDADEYTLDHDRDLVNACEGECAIQVASGQLYWVDQLGTNLCTEQVDKMHPQFGWTIRQVFEHCADAERVYGYRMLRIAAGDTTSLAGWDQNAYAEGRFGLGNFTGLIQEIVALRQANLLLLRRIVPAAWDRATVISGGRITLRAVAWLTSAHLHHHLQIVEQRCGLSVQRTPTR